MMNTMEVMVAVEITASRTIRGAHGADRGGFGGGGDAAEDRAEHGRDERQRRNESDDDLAQKVLLLRFGDGRGGTGFRVEDRLDDHPAEIERDEQEPGEQRPREEIAHGDRCGSEVALGHLHLGVDARQHVAHEDQHRGRRDDLTERARRADDAGGELGVVAGAHHGRKRDQAHGDDRRADHARRGRKQGADDDDGDSETAAQVSEELAHRQEQLLGDLGPLEHHAHEDEERHRDQHLVGHEADVAPCQRTEIGGVEHTQPHAGQPEHQRHAGEGEGHREAQHEEADDAEEHQPGEDLAEEDGIHQCDSCWFS
jgi:hypothetical protein